MLGETLVGIAPQGAWHSHALLGDTLGRAAGRFASAGQGWGHTILASLTPPLVRGSSLGPGGGVSGDWPHGRSSGLPLMGPYRGPHRHCTYPTRGKYEAGP